MKKKDFFFTHFDDFFSNFAYCNKSTKDYSIDFLKENDVNINDATLILSSVVETIEKKEKKISIN